MKILASLALSLQFFTSSSSEAATVYAIDIDSTRTSSSATSGLIFTETGFSSLDATGGGGASVNVDGVNFQLFTVGTNASRRRDSISNSLTRDFVFEEGTVGNAVGILFGGAGDLEAGTWKVEVWSYDASVPSLGDQILGLRTNNNENNAATINGALQTNGIITTTMATSAADPAATFTFLSDGVSSYDVFLRENNANQRTRLNAVRLTLIPEPSSTILMLGGMFGLALRRRRK